MNTPRNVRLSGPVIPRLARRSARPPAWLLLAAVLLVWGQFALAPQSAAGAEPAPAQQPAQSQAQPAHSQSFLQLLMKGGWFMLPIAAASLIGLALILERSMALRRSRIVPRRFMAGLKRLGADREGALAYCAMSRSPIARVITAGLRKLNDGHAATEKALEDAGAAEVHKLRRNLRMLYGVSVVAPMMGLLGTVWGMIRAFRATTEQQALGRPDILATGIYEALVTTLAGLMVAIPVLLFYYYFSGRIEAAVSDLNDAANEFVERFVDTRKPAHRHGFEARTMVE